MNILYIGVVLLAIWLIVEVLSIVFKITGLDLNKARFQVISILTHTGFTTRESELIAQHPLRRKLASILMLISYIAQASLISLVFNMISKNTGQLLYVGIFLVIFTILFFVVKRNKFVSSKFDRVIEKFIENRIMKKTKTRSVDQVLKISAGYGVYEVLVDTYSILSGVTLCDAKLNEMFIHVLKVDRGSSTIDFPEANFKMHEGDVLIVYGKIKSIKELALKKTNK